MSIKTITIDSLKYPFTNWKRFLFLVILILISLSPYIALYLVKIDFYILVCLSIIGLLFLGSFVIGYLFKIIKESLLDFNKLPTFNNWNNMFFDGIKVLVVTFIYLIPAFLILILLFYPRSFIPQLVAISYLIIIVPIILMAIANMANDNSKLTAAFKFNEIVSNVSKLSWDEVKAVSVATAGQYIPIIIGFLIFDEITNRILSIDYKKYIIWYIATGVISLTLILIGYITANITSILILNGLNLYSLSNYNLLWILILSLVFIPYLFVFISRSTALIYNYAIKSYLKSDYIRSHQLHQE